MAKKFSRTDSWYLKVSCIHFALAGALTRPLDSWLAKEQIFQKTVEQNFKDA